MASKLCRVFSSPIARSELINSASRRLLCTGTQFLQNQQPEKETKSISEDKEKIQSLIDDEKEYDSKAEGNEEDDEFVNKETGEVGGPRGPEPTRFGDWERNGRCSDF